MKTNKTIQHKASFSPIADAGFQPGLRKKKPCASGLQRLISYQWPSGQLRSRCLDSSGAFLEKQMDQLITFISSFAGHRKPKRRKPSSSKIALTSRSWSFKKNRKLMKEAKEENQASDPTRTVENFEALKAQHPTKNSYVYNSLSFSSSAAPTSSQQKHSESSSTCRKGNRHAEGIQNKIRVKNLRKNGYRDKTRPLRHIIQLQDAIRIHHNTNGDQGKTGTNKPTRGNVDQIRCENLSNGYQNPIRSNLLISGCHQGTRANQNSIDYRYKTRLHNLPFWYKLKMRSNSPPRWLSISKKMHTHPLFSPSQSATTNSFKNKTL